MIGFVTVSGPTAVATLDAYSAQHSSQCALIEERLHTKTAVPYRITMLYECSYRHEYTRPYAEDKRLIGLVGADLEMSRDARLATGCDAGIAGSKVLCCGSLDGGEW